MCSQTGNPKRVLAPSASSEHEGGGDGSSSSGNGEVDSTSPGDLGGLVNESDGSGGEILSDVETASGAITSPSGLWGGSVLQVLEGKGSHTGCVTVDKSLPAGTETRDSRGIIPWGSNGGHGSHGSCVSWREGHN